MVNKKTLLAIAIFFAIFAPMAAVFGAPTEVIYPEITSGIIPPATTKTLLPVYVKYIFSVLVALSGLIAFGSGAYAGARIALSAGDPSAFSDAKDQMFNAALGIAFTLGAVIILNTVDPQIVSVKPYIGIDLGIVLDKTAGCPDATNPAALGQTPPAIMLVPGSNPNIDASFNARCMKFRSKDPGTLEAKVYSSPDYANLIGTYNNDLDANAAFDFPAGVSPRSISFVWKIAGVYLIKANNEEKYVPASTGVLGSDFNDQATKIRFRSTGVATDPNTINFGTILHENENWSGKCKVFVTDGSIDVPTPNWTRLVPQKDPLSHGALFDVSSITTFNPTHQTALANDGVVFCTDDNFGGTCSTPYRTYNVNVDQVGIEHDSITSIKIQGNYIAILFSEPNPTSGPQYGGICEVFTKSDANLRDNPIGRCFCGPFGWGCKDCLSSFIIIPTK